MEFEFAAEVWHWRGPSPHHFLSVPPDESAIIKDLASGLSYGWGAIPISGRIGASDFTTSIFPKDGGYIVPLKKVLRAAEGIDVGDTVTVRFSLGG